MERTAVQRWGFLLLCFILLIVAGAWRPTVYGNDEASIKQYIYQKMGQELGDHVELLAVEDHNEDRFAVFRLENRKSDDVWIVRFRRNKSGDYEDYYGYIRRMLQGNRGIYMQYISALGGDHSGTYLTVWSENAELAEIWARFETQPEQIVPITETPSLTLLWSPVDVSGMTYFFYDADGNQYNM